MEITLHDALTRLGLECVRSMKLEEELAQVNEMATRLDREATDARTEANALQDEANALHRRLDEVDPIT